MRPAWVAVAVLAVACHSSPPPAHPATTTPPPTTPPPPARQGPTDDLSLLPVDSEIVFGVDFAQLSHSAIWQKYIAPKIGTLGGVDKFKALCGFDPLASLQSLAIGIRDLSAPTPAGMIVLHGYDRAKSMTCFDKDGIDEVQKDGTKVVIDGQFVMLSDPKGRQVGFTFVDDKTAVAVLGPDGASKESIERATAGMRGLRSSPSFVEMYGQLNRSDSMWMLLHGSLLKEAEGVGVHAKVVFGSLNVTDELALDARIRLATPEEANTLVSMAQAQLSSPQLKTYFSKLDVSADGTDVHLVVAMSENQLQLLAGMLGGMLGGGP